TWYFHAGSTLDLHDLAADGALIIHRMRNPLAHPDAVEQATMPAGRRFAAGLASGADHAVDGCADAPGLVFGGFQLARLDDIQPALGRHGDWVLRLLKGMD